MLKCGRYYLTCMKRKAAADREAGYLSGQALSGQAELEGSL